MLIGPAWVVQESYFLIAIVENSYLALRKLTFIILQHFSNAGFPCPIMQSPSDHFLRAINTDFDRIIAMCKNLQVPTFEFYLAGIHWLFFCIILVNVFIKVYGRCNWICNTFNRMIMGTFHLWAWIQLLQFEHLKLHINHQLILLQLNLWFSNLLKRCTH